MLEVADIKNGSEETSFPGFEPFDANFLFCPNQFFDVCLPNNSRNVNRVVAYLLFQTLGFRDKYGNPIRENIPIAYDEFVERAKISRGAIRPALDAAYDRKFLLANKSTNSRTATFRLRWSESDTYIADSNLFDGFFAGTGCRSPMPQQYFTQIVPNETLNVSKVVGTVLRFTAGYENQFGGRRPHAALDLDHIQRFAKIKCRTDTCNALNSAMSSGFIVCIDKGNFHHSASVRKPSIYAPKWQNDNVVERLSSKNLPATNSTTHDQSSKSLPALIQFKKPTSDGSKTRPETQFKKPTSIERVLSNKKNNNKDAVVDLIDNLVQQGIDDAVAKQLTGSCSAEVIRNQLKWIDYRNPDRNRPGLLVKAIKGDWSQPEQIIRREEKLQKSKESKIKHEQKVCSDKQLHHKIEADENARLMRYEARLNRWRSLTAVDWKLIRIQAAMKATNELTKLKINNSSFDNPVAELLKELDNYQTSVSV